VNITEDKGEDELPTEDLRFLRFRSSCIKECPIADAPGNADTTAFDSILEEVKKHLKLGMERRARAFRTAAARTSIKGFGNGLKVKEFPNWAPDGFSGVSEVWPVNEVTAVSNRRCSKPGLSKYRGVQVKVVKREVVEESRGVDVSRHWSFCDIHVFFDGDVKVVALTQQVEDL
jgi:hypothetical protein